MGIDACIYVRGSISGEEIGRAETFLADRLHGASLYITDDDHPMERVKVEQVVELVGLSDRYYADGYRRGQWPRIHHALVCMRAAFPGRTVWYAMDSPWEHPGQEVTDELLAELWAVWLGPDGTVYR